MDLVQGISGGEKNFTNSGNQLPLVELVTTAYSVGKKIKNKIPTLKIVNEIRLIV